MNFFKRTPAPFPTFADADKYRDAGYEVIPVELSRATEGQEFPANGPWGFGVPASSVTNHVHNVPAILGCRLPWPNSNVSVEEMRKRWLAIIRIDVYANAKVARACEGIVRNHVGSTGPVRLTDGSTATLMPFKLADVLDNPQKYTLSTGSIGCPGDTIATGSSRVSIGANGAAFIVGGQQWHWRDALDLLAVPYAELPTLSVVQAVGIITECRELLESLKPKAPPSALALRLEAARRRAQSEPDTVEVN